MHPFCLTYNSIALQLHYSATEGACLEQKRQFDGAVVRRRREMYGRVYFVCAIVGWYDMGMGLGSDVSRAGV